MLELVFSTYRDDLVRFLVARYRLSRFDLMDVLSETFCLAFSPRQRDAYSGSVKYFTYLVAIARNVTRTSLRQTARMHSGDAPEAATQGPEMQLEAAELVEKVLESLSERERSAVLMTLLDRRTQESTARHLGVDRNWVKRAVQRARSRLAQLTRREGGTDVED
ncbi:MAG: sigma-70 family RNA polymerase sigma factor [Pseudomonadota bacterium]